MKWQWTRAELAERWTLDQSELALLANKAGPTRLGFAVLLKAFGYEGRFPRSKHEVPGVTVVHLAQQVGVPAELYPRYEWSGRTSAYHRTQMRAHLGFREATVQWPGQADPSRGVRPCGGRHPSAQFGMQIPPRHRSPNNVMFMNVKTSWTMTCR